MRVEGSRLRGVGWMRAGFPAEVLAMGERAMRVTGFNRE
jgi:hypothetical protein